MCHYVQHCPNDAPVLGFLLIIMRIQLILYACVMNLLDRFIYDMRVITVNMPLSYDLTLLNKKAFDTVLL